MTSEEFILWFKGFSEACNQTTPTPLEWARIKEQLANVKKQLTFPMNGTNTSGLPAEAIITYTNKQMLND